MDRVKTQQEVYFVVQEDRHGQRATHMPVTVEVIDRMIRHSLFRMPKVCFELSNKLATAEISLCLGPGDIYPISRFPRLLIQDEIYGQGQCAIYYISPHYILVKATAEF